MFFRKNPEKDIFPHVRDRQWRDILFCRKCIFGSCCCNAVLFAGIAMTCFVKYWSAPDVYVATSDMHVEKMMEVVRVEDHNPLRNHGILEKE